MLEFNCRFGDPETQVILPAAGERPGGYAARLRRGAAGSDAPRLGGGSAATVVAASGGYPGSYTTGHPIRHRAGGSPAGDGRLPGGTRRSGGRQLLTDGGRVLAVTGVGADLRRLGAYAGHRRIHFEDALPPRHRQQGAVMAGTQPMTYRDAGVDIAAGTRAVELMKGAVRSTYGPEVLLGIGAFGGLFDAAVAGMARAGGLDRRRGHEDQDCQRCGRFDTIGHDIVNHCINDILVQGRGPLLPRLHRGRTADPVMVAAVVSRRAACRAAGAALLGGETAEMPGVYGGRSSTWRAPSSASWTAQPSWMDRDPAGDATSGWPPAGCTRTAFRSRGTCWPVTTCARRSPNWVAPWAARCWSRTVRT